MNQWEYNTIPLLLVPPELGYENAWIVNVVQKLYEEDSRIDAEVESIIISSVCSSRDIMQTIVDTTRQDRYVVKTHVHSKVCVSMFHLWRLCNCDIHVHNVYST